MLLHGVPGVGKTSTAGKILALENDCDNTADSDLAECIADLFRRPLFQITSGKKFPSPPCQAKKN